MKSVTTHVRGQSYCVCGNEATSVTDVSHGLELYLCRPCEIRLSEGLPLRYKVIPHGRHQSSH
jgi:hypothetical protein